MWVPYFHQMRNQPIPTLSFRHASKDLPAGVVVFLVALPLCLGIALASGAPLFAGILGGVVGGIVVTLFSGSELSVSGPAAGLSSIVASAIVSLGSFPVFLAAVLLAGVLQIMIAVARAGSLGSFIPHSVIKGMLAAIGLTIFLKQLPHAVGYHQQGFLHGAVVFEGTEWIKMILDPMRMLHADVIEPGAVLITVVCIAIIITWDKPRMRDGRWGKLLPGSLVSVVVGTLLNALLGVIRPEWQLRPELGHLVSLPVFASVRDVTEQLVYPELASVYRRDVWMVAITIAAIASTESVLSIKAVDKLDPRKRISDVNRELYAQGIGNALCGLIGGIPVTSVIVRSSANVYAGGVTRLASLVHGVLLLATALVVPAILNLIPLACLASILLIIGYKLASITVMREMWREGIPHAVPFVVTLVAIIATDILVGVGIGLLVSLMFSYRYRNSTET